MIKKLSTFLFIIGFVLVSMSGILTIKYYLNTNNQDNKIIVQQLYESMPEVQSGMISDFNTEMPIVEINRQNFVGIIEIPKYNCTLPIYGIWDSKIITKYPALYLGTIYDGSIILGGSDQKNQFDFMKIINEDDYLTITDMKGKRYSYVVDKIEITKDVSTEHLISLENDLVIFVKNTYSFDYTILRCNYKLG